VTRLFETDVLVGRVELSEDLDDEFRLTDDWLEVL